MGGNGPQANRGGGGGGGEAGGGKRNYDKPWLPP